MITQRVACRTAILIAVLLNFGTGARAQTSADGAAVTAANNAFYTAVSALDPVAMEKVWSREFLHQQHRSTIQNNRRWIDRSAGFL